MKLWIRSQDKTRLIECEDIYIEEFKQRDTNNFNSILINEKITYHIVVNKNILATFDLKVRALEVLDEIQNLLIGKVFVKKSKADNELDVKPVNRECFVYEMPEK